MVENKAEFTGGENPPIVYAAETSSLPEWVPQQPKEEWTCSQCTLLNPPRKLYCIACFHRHPDLTLPTTGGTEEYREYEYSTHELEDSPGHELYDRDIIVQPMDGNIDASESILEAQGEEDPYHKKIRRRVRRKKRMVAGGLAGATVGAVLVGPSLFVAGAVAGAVGTRIVSKQKERQKDERLARERYLMASAASAK